LTAKKTCDTRKGEKGLGQLISFGGQGRGALNHVIDRGIECKAIFKNRRRQ